MQLRAVDVACRPHDKDIGCEARTGTETHHCARRKVRADQRQLNAFAARRNLIGDHTENFHGGGLFRSLDNAKGILRWQPRFADDERDRTGSQRRVRIDGKLRLDLVPAYHVRGLHADSGAGSKLRVRRPCEVGARERDHHTRALRPLPRSKTPQNRWRRTGTRRRPRRSTRGSRYDERSARLQRAIANDEQHGVWPYLRDGIDLHLRRDLGGRNGLEGSDFESCRRTELQAQTSSYKILSGENDVDGGPLRALGWSEPQKRWEVPTGS